MGDWAIRMRCGEINIEREARATVVASTGTSTSSSSPEYGNAKVSEGLTRY